MSNNQAGATLRVEFCDSWTAIPSDRAWALGRDADLIIDDNPFLHRRFLELHRAEGMWWLANVGQRLSATVTDVGGSMHAWLGPGARLPLVFDVTVLRFAAGATSYEVSLHLDPGVFQPTPSGTSVSGETTRGDVVLTPEQHLLVVALAEPALRASGRGMASLPSSSAAAARLGWPLTKFNRKLDHVCQKLGRAGVAGLHGCADQLASGRRAQLVHHALATRLVSIADLALLDQAPDEPIGAGARSAS